MNRYVLVMLCGVIVCGIVMFFAYTSSAEAQTELGTLTPFYRSTQLQGHLIGMGLIEIPDYVLDPDVDFKYKKKAGMQREIPFVDTFTINRFLGGYREDWLKKFNRWDERYGIRSLDYAIKVNGSLIFRPELIKLRLQPYLDAGYRPEDITIALENVPWDLARVHDPKMTEGPWGQKEPAENPKEWREVVNHFANDLKSYLGGSASGLRFKTGVEYDEKASFDGGLDDFVAYYVATEQGLHAGLPGVALSTGEFTAGGECTPQTRTCVYDTAEFLRIARNHNIPVSYVPRSLHSFLNVGNPMPSASIARAVNSYARLPPDTVKEIHQFGLLDEPFGAQDGNDPAALQANFEFQVLMGLWERLKPRRVFHWGGFVAVGDMQFLNGSGYLRLVLDHYVGYNAIKLSPQDAPSGRTETVAVGFVGGPSSALILSSFSPDLTASVRRQVRVELPAAILGGNAPGLRTIRYRGSDNVYSLIRQDLAADGNLKPEFQQCPLCVGVPMLMASDGARAKAMLARKFGRYAAKMKSELRWNNADAEVALQGRQLDAVLEANELLVVERAGP